MLNNVKQWQKRRKKMEQKKLTKEEKEKLEKMAIEEALRITKGNISHSAEALKITRATLYRKMKKYKIDKQ